LSSRKGDRWSPARPPPEGPAFEVTGDRDLLDAWLDNSAI
jgi:hypothetical protein